MDARAEIRAMKTIINAFRSIEKGSWMRVLEYVTSWVHQHRPMAVWAVKADEPEKAIEDVSHG